MQEQLSHKQQILGAGIRMSDARRRRSEEDSPGLVLQYELILGFLQKIGPVLAEYSELHMFYFPVKSEQLLCVYRIANMPEPLPVELRPYLITTLANARQLFTETLDERSLSSYHKPLEDLTYQHETRQQEMVINIILATLGGHLPYTHPKAATSLVICCPIPDKIAAASKRLRDLSGLLILFGDEQNFSQSSHSSLVKTVNKEFNRYIEETGQYAIRELDFFLSSLISQDERIQDNQNRALRAEEFGERVVAPAQDEEFVIRHSDNVQATGFVEHLKLPHYVDFQAELGLVRHLRAEFQLRVDEKPEPVLTDLADLAEARA
jgi:hypothetical protein